MKNFYLKPLFTNGSLMRIYSVKYLFSLFFLLIPSVFILIQPIFANDDDIAIANYSGKLFSQDFEGHFPPDGWDVKSHDAQSEWKQVEVSPDGEHKTSSGEKFVCVVGNASSSYPSALVTEKFDYREEIEDNDDCSYGDYELLFFRLGSDPEYFSNFTITVESGDEFVEAFRCTGDETDWISCKGYFDIELNPGRIWFEYTGEEETYICLDRISLSYSCTIIEKNKDGPSDDDGCGCSLSRADSSTSTPFVMFITALAALIISKIRRTH